jgi:hypothetical protein
MALVSPLLTAAVSSTASTPARPSVADLRSERKTSPIVIDSPRPRLSWKLSPADTL